MPDELSTAEAAQTAGVSKQAIIKAIDAGHLDARPSTPQANSPKLISRKSFDAWMKKRGQPSPG